MFYKIKYGGSARLETRSLNNLITISQNISNTGSEFADEKTAVKRSFFSNIEIVVTSRCNIGCRHCIYDCKPFSKEKLSKTVIKDLVRQAAVLDSVRSVVFTGGEAFLEYNSLVEGISLCEELGLESSVVTNGFWALDSHITRQKLKGLKGLKTLNVSTDSFHQEFIRADRIRNIIESCHELGINCGVRVSYLNDQVSEIGMIKEQLKGLEGLYIISAMPVAPFGRAATLKDTGLTHVYETNGVPCCGADDPVIDANGDVKVCPGGLFSHPGNNLLKVGNIYDETLEKIKKSTDLNPIVHMLRLRGPSGLVHLVRNQALKDEVQCLPPKIEEVRDLCSLCKYVVTNPYNAEILQRAVKDPEVYYEIALARLEEFGETSMLDENMCVMTERDMTAETDTDTIVEQFD
jgi:MoaA/NifB/PqqE/SkfB family radical SAM enzyme